MCPAIAQAIFLSSSKATSERSIQDLSKSSPTLGQFEVHESREQFFSSQLNVSKLIHSPRSSSICVPDCPSLPTKWLKVTTQPI